MTPKEAQKKLVNVIVDGFQASGREYTCGAVVMDFAHTFVTSMTREDKAPYIEYGNHRLFTMDMLKHAAWREMQRRYEGK